MKSFTQEAFEIPFGEPYYIHQHTANIHRKVSRTDKFPILSTLKKLMELGDYQAEILNPHPTRSHLLMDFCDGSLFHYLLICMPFKFVGYYGDLEVVNPLGSYTQKSTSLDVSTSF